MNRAEKVIKFKQDFRQMCVDNGVTYEIWADNPRFGPTVDYLNPLVITEISITADRAITLMDFSGVQDD